MKSGETGNEEAEQWSIWSVGVMDLTGCVDYMDSAKQRQGGN
jgi:hypothetical protein